MIWNLYVFIMFLWQLPQNILGIIVVLLSGAKRNGGRKLNDVWFTEHNFGVSLGEFIIVNIFASPNTIRHERGHRVQSAYLGWLYLPVIGLPSALGNLWDRVAHKKWTYIECKNWYYNLPWEKWADKLGGVVR